MYEAAKLLLAKAGDHLDVAISALSLLYISRNEYRITQIEKRPDKMKVVSCDKVREACIKDIDHRFAEVDRRFESGSRGFRELKELISRQAEIQRDQHNQQVELLVSIAQKKS